jgi:GNAT superfamily N-acetyltransferase
MTTNPTSAPQAREVALRPATAEDSEFCLSVHCAAMRDYIEAIWGWDEAVQRAFHDRGFDPGRTRIITVDGRDGGMLVVDYGPAEVYLARIELLPDLHGQGIGTRLIHGLLHEAAARHQPLTLDVLTVNPRAHRLYQRLGFRDAGRHGDRNVKIRMSAGGATP